MTVFQEKQQREVTMLNKLIIWADTLPFFHKAALVAVINAVILAAIYFMR